MKKTLSISIAWLLLCTIFANLGHIWFGFDLFSPFLVYYLLAAIIILIIGIMLRMPYTLSIASLVFMVNLLNVAPIYWFEIIPEVQAAQSRNTIKLLHANVLLSNQNHESLLKLIRKEQPDIISLQELTPKWAKSIRALTDIYPYYKIESRPGAFGIALLSKLKAKIKLLPLAEQYSPSLMATIETANGELRLISSHPIVPIKQSWYQTRNKHLDYLANFIGQGKQRIIVGDLNITRWSPIFRRWQKRLQMNNARDGFGIVATWPTFPLIAIDHCLVSKDVHVDNFYRGENIGSDHWPIIVDLSI